MSGISLKTNC